MPRRRAFLRQYLSHQGLRNLLAKVFRRLTGAGGEVASILRLDTFLRRRQDPRADRPCTMPYSGCRACRTSRSSSPPPCCRADPCASQPMTARMPTRPMDGRWATAVFARTPVGQDRPCAGWKSGLRAAAGDDFAVLEDLRGLAYTEHVDEPQAVKQAVKILEGRRGLIRFCCVGQCFPAKGCTSLLRPYVSLPTVSRMEIRTIWSVGGPHV